MGPAQVTESVGVLPLAMRKSAPKLTLSCTVQKPMNFCVPALVRVNWARTFV